MPLHYNTAARGLCPNCRTCFRVNHLHLEYVCFWLLADLSEVTALRLLLYGKQTSFRDDSYVCL